MLRTMELILGMRPMSQFDAAAMPMYRSFQAKPDMRPYAAAKAEVDVEEVNSKLAWGASKSKKMNFLREDAADDLALNEIIWRSVAGRTRARPGAAAFCICAQRRPGRRLSGWCFSRLVNASADRRRSSLVGGEAWELP